MFTAFPLGFKVMMEECADDGWSDGTRHSEYIEWHTSLKKNVIGARCKDLHDRMATNPLKREVYFLFLETPRSLIDPRNSAIATLKNVCDNHNELWE